MVARYADRVNIMYAGKIIERGRAREIYGNPRHPYTVGLLKSVPRLDQPRRGRLEPIEGQPPDLVNASTEGCSVSCPGAAGRSARCETEAPPLMETAAGHWSACWQADQLGIGALEQQGEVACRGRGVPRARPTDRGMVGAADQSAREGGEP